MGPMKTRRGKCGCGFFEVCEKCAHQPIGQFFREIEEPGAFREEKKREDKNV